MPWFAPFYLAMIPLTAAYLRAVAPPKHTGEWMMSAVASALWPAVWLFAFYCLVRAVTRRKA